MRPQLLVLVTLQVYATLLNISCTTHSITAVPAPSFVLHTIHAQLAQPILLDPQLTTIAELVQNREYVRLHSMLSRHIAVRSDQQYTFFALPVPASWDLPDYPGIRMLDLLPLTSLQHVHPNQLTLIAVGEHDGNFTHNFKIQLRDKRAQDTWKAFQCTQEHSNMPDMIIARSTLAGNTGIIISEEFEDSPGSSEQELFSFLEFSAQSVEHDHDLVPSKFHHSIPSLTWRYNHWTSPNAQIFLEEEEHVELHQKIQKEFENRVEVTLECLLNDGTDCVFKSDKDLKDLKFGFGGFSQPQAPHPENLTIDISGEEGTPNITGIPGGGEEGAKGTSSDPNLILQGPSKNTLQEADFSAPEGSSESGSKGTKGSDPVEAAAEDIIPPVIPAASSSTSAGPQGPAEAFAYMPSAGTDPLVSDKAEVIAARGGSDPVEDTGTQEAAKISDSYAWCDLTDPFSNPMCPFPPPWFIILNLIIKCMVPGVITPVVQDLAGEVINARKTEKDLAAKLFIQLDESIEHSNHGMNVFETETKKLLDRWRNHPYITPEMFNVLTGRDVVASHDAFRLADSFETRTSPAELVKKITKKHVRPLLAQSFLSVSEKLGVKVGEKKGNVMIPAVESGLVSGLSDSLVDGLTSALTTELTRDIVPKLHDTMADNLLTDLLQRLGKDVTLGIAQTTSTSVGAVVPDMIVKVLPSYTVKSFTETMMKSLTRSVGSSVSLTLVHMSVTKPAQFHFCYYCQQSSFYCSLCDSEAMEWTQLLQYYSSYYSAYFSDYFGSSFLWRPDLYEKT